MKVPFSYTQHVFQSILFVSFVSHAVVLGFGSIFAPSPQYAVEQAPSSMEVIIVNEHKIKEETKEIPKEVISVDDPALLVSEVAREEKKERQEEKLKEPIYIPSVKGAVAEAKPAYIKNPAPIYPEYARRQGWEGVVFLKVLVHADGTVGEIEVFQSSGYQILDESAFKTVRTWQFLPARVGGLSFSSWVKIPVRFLLVEES